MKIRQGLVSNSSSSSFTCDVCNETLVGWDGDYGGVNTWTCTNKHQICDDDTLEEIDNEEEDFENDEIPEKYCPICQWQVICHRDASRLLLEKYKVPRNEAFEEVKRLNRRRKKLYDYEYTAYVCIKLSLDLRDELDQAKKEFASYSDFLKSVMG